MSQRRSQAGSLPPSQSRNQPHLARSRRFSMPRGPAPGASRTRPEASLSKSLERGAEDRMRSRIASERASLLMMWVGRNRSRWMSSVLKSPSPRSARESHAARLCRDRGSLPKHSQSVSAPFRRASPFRNGNRMLPWFRWKTSGKISMNSRRVPVISVVPSCESY